jgi:uncharacterized protein (TIGR00369 family)
MKLRRGSNRNLALPFIPCVEQSPCLCVSVVDSLPVLESSFPMSKQPTSKHTPAHGHTGKDHPVQNTCFACGKGNPDGMQLDFFFDEAAHTALCEFNLPAKFQGPPGHAHGGIIATILDEAMGKVNKLRNVLALTKSMNVEYLKPVPLGKNLTVTGRELRVEGRNHINAAEISDETGALLARSVGTFVAIDIKKMFAKHLQLEE